MNGDPENFFSRLLRQLSGDKTPPKPVKPAAPKRPASFYDLPEDITQTPGEAPAERFQSEADALRFERPGAKSGAAVPSVMHEFRDETARPPAPKSDPVDSDAHADEHEDDEEDDWVDEPDEPREPPPPPVPIPPKLATLTEQGGKLLIAYAPRRKLLVSIILLLLGSAFAAIGLLAMVGNQPSWGFAIGIFLVGSLMDVVAVHLLVSNLHVTAGGGQLAVDKRGLFGLKHLQAAYTSVTKIEPTLSYTVTTGGNVVHYYTVLVHTDSGATVPVGYGIPGADVADSIAYRVASALKLPAEVVTPVSYQPYDPE